MNTCTMIPSHPVASFRATCARAVGLSAAIAAAVAVAAVPGTVAGQQPAARTPDVHFVPTPMSVVNEMLSVARVGKDDRLFDLGSGDGRIVITAAKRFGTRGTGIDIDPQRIKESLHNADTAGVSRLVEFRQADLFQTDLKSATVVTLYLLPTLNVKLRPKLFAELRPGTRIVSHAFDMGDWEADSVIRADGRTVYYWVIPANIEGTWTVTTGAAGGGGDGRSFDVRLNQRYQMLTGSATVGGRQLSVIDGRVGGDSVMFTLGDSTSTAEPSMRFVGRVTQSGLSGTMTRGQGGGAGTPWRAARRGGPSSR